MGLFNKSKVQKQQILQAAQQLEQEIQQAYNIQVRKPLSHLKKFRWK